MTAKEFLEYEYGIILTEEKALIHPRMLIKVMDEYAQMVVKNLDIPDVIKCVRTCLCENPVHDIEDASMCGNCGEDLGEHCC